MWTVDTNLDHDHLHDVLPSSKPSTEAASQVHHDSGEGEAEEDASDGVSKSKGPAPFPGNISPRMLWDLKRALIIKISHIGGHKYTGNVIVSELAPFALANMDQVPSTLAPSPARIAILNGLGRTYTPPLPLTSQRPPSSTSGVAKTRSHEFPIYSVARYLAFRIHRSDFRYLSTSYLLFLNPVRNPKSVSSSFSLDLYSCGTVDLVRSRHCPRG